MPSVPRRPRCSLRVGQLLHGSASIPSTNSLQHRGSIHGVAYLSAKVCKRRLHSWLKNSSSGSACSRTAHASQASYPKSGSTKLGRPIATSHPQPNHFPPARSNHSHPVCSTVPPTRLNRNRHLRYEQDLPSTSFLRSSILELAAERDRMKAPMFAELCLYSVCYYVKPFTRLSGFILGRSSKCEASGLHPRNWKPKYQTLPGAG